MTLDQIVLLALVVGGLYFLFQGVYAIRYKKRYQRNWLSEKLLRRTPRQMEEGMLRTQGALRLLYGFVLLAMALYFWRVGG